MGASFLSKFQHIYDAIFCWYRGYNLKNQTFESVGSTCSTLLRFTNFLDFLKIIEGKDILIFVDFERNYICFFAF